MNFPTEGRHSYQFKVLGNSGKLYRQAGINCFLLVLLTCCSMEVSHREYYEHRQIDSLFIKCIPFNTRREIPIRNYQEILLRKHDVYSTILDDKKYLSRYDSLIKISKSKKFIYYSVDLRIVCIAYYNNVFDTIGIDNVHGVYFNGGCVGQDTNLLRLLSEKFPYEYQWQIEEWIEFLRDNE